MHESEIGPEAGPVPVVGIAVGELRAPALHQADHGDDHDADGEREQPAPFAGGRETEGEAGEREPEMRPRLAEAVHERRDREQAERQRENIQHRDPRLHEHHLVEEGEQGRGDRGALRREQREAAKIHRDDRKRSEQHARIAPAQRHIAEDADRQRDQLLGQRRMHRVEHRARHHRLEHLPRRRHIMHFVEVEFFRRGQADQQREMRDNENDGGNHRAPRGWNFREQKVICAQVSRIHDVAAKCRVWAGNIFKSIALNAFRFRRH